MKDALTLLQSIQKDRRVCFHGSKKHLNIVEPRQASCTSGSLANCQYAVYATPDHLEVAIVMALLDRIAGFDTCTSGYTCSDNGPLVVTGMNATFTPGWIHILPTDTFEWFEDEYISRVSVTPIAVVRILPSILRLMPNVELHIPIPPPY